LLADLIGVEDVHHDRQVVRLRRRDFCEERIGRVPDGALPDADVRRWRCMVSGQRPEVSDLGLLGGEQALAPEGL
jgi:hypothetical protein